MADPAPLQLDQPNQPRKKRSWVWEHFTEINFPDPNTKRRATCVFCQQNFACDSKKNGTGGLGIHLTQHCASEENPFIVREEHDALLRGKLGLGSNP